MKEGNDRNILGAKISHSAISTISSTISLNVETAKWQFWHPNFTPRGQVFETQALKDSLLNYPQDRVAFTVTSNCQSTKVFDCAITGVDSTTCSFTSTADSQISTSKQVVTTDHAVTTDHISVSKHVITAGRHVVTTELVTATIHLVTTEQVTTTLDAITTVTPVTTIINYYSGKSTAKSTGTGGPTQPFSLAEVTIISTPASRIGLPPPPPCLPVEPASSAPNLGSSTVAVLLTAFVIIFITVGTTLRQFD